MLSGSYQISGAAWTRSGKSGDEQALKHRSAKDTRVVPAHPELVAILRHPLEHFGVGVQGRLFVTRTGKAGVPLSPPYSNPLSMGMAYRVWSRAREAALTPEQFASPLGRRPYDLRHACLSTWLTAGVPGVREVPRRPGRCSQATHPGGARAVRIGLDPDTAEGARRLRLVPDQAGLVTHCTRDRARGSPGSGSR